MLGLCCCMGFFPPAAESGGCSLVAVAGSSLQWLLLLLRLQGTWATLFVAWGLSSSGFWAPGGLWYTGLVAPQHVDPLDQGLKPCLLHWLVDSVPLSQQGSPAIKVSLALLRGLMVRCSSLMDIKLSSLLHRLPAIPAAKRCLRKRGKFSLFPGCLLPSVSNARFDQLLHV